MSHRVLLRLAAATVVLLAAGCGDLEANVEPELSPTPSATAAVSPTPAEVEEAAEEGEDGGEGRQTAGDCAAYADSDSWCTEGIGDYDCEGGSGDGPNYAPGDLEVVEPGEDPFGLDRDNDGVGCQSQAADPAPAPAPEPDTDPRYDTCGEAIAAGYGPYYRGSDPEYDWYRDADGDGMVCE